MRKSIKFSILLLFITASTFIAFAETGIDYTQVREDIEVMAKVIDKAIQKEFPDEARVGSPFFSRGLGGCQGIYLKGYGAVFMTSIWFPVAEKKIDREENAPDDLWQEAKSELTGSGGGGRGYGSSLGEYSSGKVEKLRAKLLEVIATYGPNIRQLGSQENIVIAVQGTSLPDAPFVYTTGPAKVITPHPPVHVEKLEKPLIVPELNDALAPGEPAVPSEPVIPGKEIPAPEELKKLQNDREELAKKAGQMKKEADAMKQSEVELKKIQKNIAEFTIQQKASTGSADVFMSYIGMTDTPRSRTTLVIKASKDSIMAYKNGTINLNGFLNQAEITQY